MCVVPGRRFFFVRHANIYFNSFNVIKYTILILQMSVTFYMEKICKTAFVSFGGFLFWDFLTTLCFVPYAT